MIRVVLIAPTPTLRAGLRGLLAAPRSFEIVAEAANFDDLSDDIDQIDVVVLADDSLLDQYQGLHNPSNPLAVVLVSDNDQLVSELHNLPLRGWALVSSEVSGSELQAAINSAAQGMVSVPLALSSRLLGPRQTLPPPSESLTPRELEVLELLSEGLSNKLIARRLIISEHTVKFHVASIFTKLGASSRADAVSRGARSGLIML
jgi:Response regulator containing a CheY-like receiver domain and an HTH DNA-binding domain